MKIIAVFSIPDYPYVRHSISRTPASLFKGNSILKCATPPPNSVSYEALGKGSQNSRNIL